MSGKIEDFLDEYLRQANNFTDEVIAQLESIFNETIDLVYAIFGEDALIMPPYRIELKTPQKTVYDPLFQSMSKYISYKNQLIKKASTIKDNKYSQNTYIDETKGIKLFSGRDNLPSAVKRRIEYFDILFEEYIH